MRSKQDDALLRILKRLGPDDCEYWHVEAIARALPNPLALDLLSCIPTQDIAIKVASVLTKRSDERVLQAVVAYALRSEWQLDNMRTALEGRYRSDDRDIRLAVMQAWCRLGDVDRIAKVVTDTPLLAFGDEHRHDVSEAVVMLRSLSSDL